MHACDRRTDGQNYDSQDRPRICSRGKNGRLGLHGTEHSKCNHLTTLGFKGLMPNQSGEQRNTPETVWSCCCINMDISREGAVCRLFWFSHYRLQRCICVASFAFSYLFMCLLRSCLPICLRQATDFYDSLSTLTVCQLESYWQLFAKFFHGIGLGTRTIGEILGLIWIGISNL